MLIFVTTAWAGARPIYEPWHIVNTDRMLRRHLTIPFRHICVTDNVEGVRAESIEAVPLWPVNPKLLPEQTARHYLNNWLRLGLFDYPLMHDRLGITPDDVLVSIDADIVIRRNIDHLFRDLPAFKIMSLKMRQHLQGGLFAVRPGQVEPNPWIVLHENSVIMTRCRRWGGSDQALLCELFYESTVRGHIPVWNEDDGLAINTQFDYTDWALFFRTGHRKCWDVRMPESVLYYENSGRDYVRDARKPDILPPLVTGRARTGRNTAPNARRIRVLQIEKRKP